MGDLKNFLDQQFAQMPFFLAAEHGAFYKPVGGGWQSRISSDIHTWYPEVEKVMLAYAERVPFSFVEKKEAALVWHYRRSPVEFADYQSKKLDDELQVGLANEPVAVVLGAKIVEAKAVECNKGSFVRWLMQESAEKNAYYICIGDDRTDEDMFQILEKQGGGSIKVGPGCTQARYRLSAQTDMLDFLNEMRLSLGHAHETELLQRIV